MNDDEMKGFTYDSWSIGINSSSDTVQNEELKKDFFKQPTPRKDGKYYGRRIQARTNSGSNDNIASAGF